MAIAREDAARALEDAAEAAGRSQRLAGYRGASGFLLLWGVIWGIGDLVSYVDGRAGQWTWLAGDIIGAMGSILLGLRLKANRADLSPRGRIAAPLLIMSAIVLFATGVGIVSPLRSMAQAQAVGGLTVGCAYIAMGAVRGVRIAAIGAAMVVITLGGWVFAHEQFMLWMALAGGGGLLLGGLWLRTV